MRIFPYLFAIALVVLPGCDAATLQQIGSAMVETSLTEGDISNGLKAALSQGAEVAVDQLSKENGYLRSAYKIELPDEVQQVTGRLQSIPGFSNLEDLLLEKINRGAENAASKAKPIFVNAIKSMTIQDATSILMGSQDAATTYLNRTTRTQLDCIKTFLKAFIFQKDMQRQLVQ